MTNIEVTFSWTGSMWPLAQRMQHRKRRMKRSANSVEANLKTYSSGDQDCRSDHSSWLLVGQDQAWKLLWPGTHSDGPGKDWLSLSVWFHITDQDVYSGRALEEDGVTLIHPICLPPFGPVDWRMTRSCTTLSLLSRFLQRGRENWFFFVACFVHLPLVHDHLRVASTWK